ncbi:MAG: MFS transporter [Afipia sp.]|nr:MFS transporter [Afipia sp.]
MSNSNENTEIGPVQKRSLASSFIGWMFDGYETSVLILVGASAIAALSGLTNPAEIRVALGTAISATLLGWAIGGVIGSIAADYFGRKKMLMIAIGGYCLFTAFTAASQSVTMLIALRLLTGIFLGSEWSTGTALVAETWPRRARAKALGIMQSGFGFGFFLAAGLWLYIQPLAGPDAWRWMFLIGVLPALVLIYIRRGLPESELWLEAIKEIEKKKAGQRQSTVVEIFRDPVSRGRIFGTLILSSVTVAVFYSVNALIGPHVGGLAAKQGLVAAQWATISVMIYNVGAICGYISAGFIADALGRKPYMAITFLGTIASGLFVYLMSDDLTVTLIGIFILGTFTLGVFSWMPIYLPELFATHVRSTASGVVFNLARLVAFPMPILTAFLFSQLGGFKPVILCLTLIYVISLITLMFLPETKDKPLPSGSSV